MTPNLPTGAQVDALGQFPRTVTLDLYPGKEGPEPGVLPRPMSAFQIYAREVSACTESFAPPARALLLPLLPPSSCPRADQQARKLEAT